MPTFSAALLAGGQSRRMGRDKALLPHPDGGLFWERQLALVEHLGPEEIFWSGPARPGLPPRVQVIADAAADAGPLGGITACLAAMRTELLVVLAVDLVNLQHDFLRRLLASSTALKGAITQHDSYYEPLAAVYPRPVAAIASSHLAQGRLALQDLVEEAARAGMMQVIPIDANDAPAAQKFQPARGFACQLIFRP